MATQNKKSPDNARKANRKAVCLKLGLALMSLLAVLLLTQRPASTQSTAPQDTLRIERMGGVEVVAGQVIVRFDTPDLPTRLNHALSVADASAHRQIGAASLDLFRISSRSLNVSALVSALSSLPGVQYAEPNYVVRSTLTPNDTRFGELWGLNNTGQTISGQTGIAGADISAVSAWDVSTGPTGPTLQPPTSSG